MNNFWNERGGSDSGHMGRLGLLNVEGLLERLQLRRPRRPMCPERTWRPRRPGRPEAQEAQEAQTSPANGRPIKLFQIAAHISVLILDMSMYKIFHVSPGTPACMTVE